MSSLMKSGMLAAVWRATTLHPSSPSQVIVAAFVTKQSVPKPNVTRTTRFSTTGSARNSFATSRGGYILSPVSQATWKGRSAAVGDVVTVRVESRGGVSMMARGGRGRSGGRGGNRNPRVDRGAGGHQPGSAGQHRSNVPPGTSVEVVQKAHQRTGQLTTGTVSRLLTNSAFHPRGIKVMLSGGIVGRVYSVVGSDGQGATFSPTRVVLPDVTGGYGSSSSGSADRDAVYDCMSPSTVFANGQTPTSTSTIGTGRRRQEQRRPQTTALTPDTVRASTTRTPTTNINFKRTGETSSTARNSSTMSRSTTTNTSHARAPAASAAAAAAANSSPPPPAARRQVRTFRAERVQGRSWSLDDDGELVATGECGEELHGERASVEYDSDRLGGGRGGWRGRGGRESRGTGGKR